MAGQRESSPNAVNGLRRGSVLDVLCPQAKPVTGVSTVQTSGMLLLSYADVIQSVSTSIFCRFRQFDSSQSTVLVSFQNVI